MDDEFGNVLNAAQSVLFILPQNPRLDWVASALSLSNSLAKSGKTASVVCPTPMTVEFSRLVDVDKINDRLGDKNLVIRFADYDASGIDTVTYNVENNQFELVVVTKGGVVPPTAKQIQTNYSGVSAEAIVFVGVKDRNQLGKLNRDEIFQGPKMAYVGILQPQPDIPVVAALANQSVASFSEMVAKFLESQHLPFDQDIANNLLYGIESATEGFSSGNTSALTFEAAAICLRRGAVRQFQQVRSARSGVNQWRHQRDESQFQSKGGGQFKTQPPAQGPATAVQPQTPQPAAVRPQSPSPDWLEPKIYTGRTVV